MRKLVRLTIVFLIFWAPYLAKAQFSVFVAPNTSFTVNDANVSASGFNNNGTTGLFGNATITMTGTSPFINNSLVTLSEPSPLIAATDDTPTITGDFENTGEVLLDINTATHASDVLTIDGDVLSPLVINVNNIDGSSADGETIPLIRVTGDPSTATLSGGGTSYSAAGVNYVLRLVGDTWSLVVRSNQSLERIPSLSIFGWLMMLLSLLGIAWRHFSQRSHARP